MNKNKIQVNTNINNEKNKDFIKLLEGFVLKLKKTIFEEGSVKKIIDGVAIIQGLKIFIYFIYLFIIVYYSIIYLQYLNNINNDFIIIILKILYNIYIYNKDLIIFIYQILLILLYLYIFISYFWIDILWIYWNIKNFNYKTIGLNYHYKVIFTIRKYNLIMDIIAYGYFFAVGTTVLYFFTADIIEIFFIKNSNNININNNNSINNTIQNTIITPVNTTGLLNNVPCESNVVLSENLITHSVNGYGVLSHTEVTSDVSTPLICCSSSDVITSENNLPVISLITAREEARLMYQWYPFVKEGDPDTLNKLKYLYDQVYLKKTHMITPLSFGEFAGIEEKKNCFKSMPIYNASIQGLVSSLTREELNESQQIVETHLKSYNYKIIFQRICFYQNMINEIQEPNMDFIRYCEQIFWLLQNFNYYIEQNLELHKEQPNFVYLKNITAESKKIIEPFLVNFPHCFEKYRELFKILLNNDSGIAMNKLHWWYSLEKFYWFLAPEISFYDISAYYWPYLEKEQPTETLQSLLSNAKVGYSWKK